MPFPTTGLLDNFNRADANPLDGNWTNGWWGDGNPKIVSNQLLAAGAGYSGSRYSVGIYGPDCEVFISLPVKDGFILALRVSSNLTSPNGYYLSYTGGTTIDIKRLTSGSGTKLGASVNITIANGDKIGFSAVASVLTLYQYTGGVWTALDTRTDTTYPDAGYLAVELIGTTIRGDDFSGGKVVSGIAIPILMNQYKQRRE